MGGVCRRAIISSVCIWVSKGVQFQTRGRALPVAKITLVQQVLSKYYKCDLPDKETVSWSHFLSKMKLAKFK